MEGLNISINDIKDVDNVERAKNGKHKTQFILELNKRDQMFNLKPYIPYKPIRHAIFEKLYQNSQPHFTIHKKNLFIEIGALHRAIHIEEPVVNLVEVNISSIHNIRIPGDREIIPFSHILQIQRYDEDDIETKIPGMALRVNGLYQIQPVNFKIIVTAISFHIDINSFYIGLDGISYLSKKCRYLFEINNLL